MFKKNVYFFSLGGGNNFHLLANENVTKSLGVHKTLTRLVIDADNNTIKILSNDKIKIPGIV